MTLLAVMFGLSDCYSLPSGKSSRRSGSFGRGAVGVVVGASGYAFVGFRGALLRR